MLKAAATSTITFLERHVLVLVVFLAFGYIIYTFPTLAVHHNPHDYYKVTTTTTNNYYYYDKRTG